jgi:hypothetical protein
MDRAVWNRDSEERNWCQKALSFSHRDAHRDVGGRATQGAVAEKARMSGSESGSGY